MSSITNFISSLPTSLFPQQQQQQQNSDETNKSDENSFEIVLPPSMDESSTPITGICLVTKPENVPTGYTCIRKAYDEPSKDADLMPNSVFERKDRFVCITRIYPLAGGSAKVLEDIKMINERDAPPPAYTALTHTVDGHEKATSRRTICVKLVDRQAGITCICDIIFLLRSKRPPQYYTIIGEINGLQMCVKEGTVPNFRLPPPIPGPQSDYRFNSSSHRQPSLPDYSNTNTLTKKSDEKEILDGIPFHINSKYLSTSRSNQNSHCDIDSFRILSPYEIDQLFYYDFHLEHSSLY